MNPGVPTRWSARGAIPAALIAVAATWAFWPALRGSWLWDDDLEIVRNPWVHELAGWWKPWLQPTGMDYFPLKDTLHWLQWQCWGDATLGYHLTNLALHILGAWLLWRLLGKLGVPQPWLGGLFFAVHPVAVESVAWISEFKNTASLPPLLLSLAAYCDFDGAVDRGGRGDRTGPRRLKYLAALAWFVVAMLCKTSVVMLPAALLLLAWWRRQRIGWSDLRTAAPFFAVSAGLGIVTLHFQAHRAMAEAPAVADLGTRLGEAGWIIAGYFRTCLFPGGLAPIYEPFGGGLPGVIPWAVLVAVLVWFWSCRAGWGRHALLGTGWFLLNLLPVVGILPMAYFRVAHRADHLAYVSLAGIAGLLAAALGAAWSALGSGRRFRRAAGAGVVGAAVSWLMVSSHGYAAIFRSDEALWRAAVARSPGAWLAHSNLGRILLGQGALAEARQQFERALLIRPDSAEVHANLGSALDGLHLAADAQAQYAQAVELDPRFAGGHYDLGRSLLQAGRPADAAAELRRAVELDPGYAIAHNNLGLALMRLDDAAGAMAEYRAALRCDPRLPEARLNLGNAYLRLGRFEEAIENYRAALRLNPAYGAAHRNLGAALHAVGRDEEARAQWQAAPALGRP